LVRQIGLALETRSSVLAKVTGQMDSLSPLAVLARGYCIARRPPTFEVIREAKEVAEGERLNLRLHKGELVCQVNEVYPEA
jgi:exodeoxyribonuclease VII large subunit